MKNVYTPNDFSNLDSDSAMIQAAVDEAARYGARVEIPRYNERTQKCLWELDQTILLHTGSNVVLDNCHLRLCDYKYISFFTNSGSGNWRKEKRRILQRDRQYDIAITGVGNAILDGGIPVDMCEADFNHYDENGDFVKCVTVKGVVSMHENIGLRFVNVERITVSNLRFIHNRYWTMAFWYCSSGTVRNISIETMNNVPNQDGVNLRLGCHNFLVENIDGKTGDDTVALTALDYGKERGSEDGMRQQADMNCNIHDIIIRNIRSFQTGECDMIRILCRGDAQIYNVLIDGVFDLTDPCTGKRPLAAIRVGDLCDYPLRLNRLGETRNLMIRNVVTHARFGAYIANTLSDSCFDLIKLTADAGIGMYFNGCELKNVSVRGLCYDITANTPDSDLGYQEIFHRVRVDELSAVHFNNCKAENLRFQGLVSGRNLKYVFGGNSSIMVKVNGLEMLDERTKLTDCACVQQE